MWICKNCNEENEDTFDSCWNCGIIKEGNSFQSPKAFQAMKEEISEEKEMLLKAKSKTLFKIKRPRGVTFIFWIFIFYALLSIVFLTLLYFSAGFKPRIRTTVDYIIIFNVIYPLFIGFGLRFGFNWIRILFLLLTPISIIAAFIKNDIGQLPLMISTLLYIVFLFILISPNVIAFFIQTDKTLPPEVKCPHCGIELGLSSTERVKRLFTCSECNKEINMN